MGRSQTERPASLADLVVVVATIILPAAWLLGYLNFWVGIVAWFVIVLVLARRDPDAMAEVRRRRIARDNRSDS